LLAVFVGIAVAGHGVSDAFTLLAFVSHGTGVLVVAIRLVVRVDASHVRLAEVVRAGVFVKAVCGGSDAQSCLAMVFQSTEVAVVAGHARLRLVLASQYGVATVCGAGVAIIAGDLRAGHAGCHCALVANGADAAVVTQQAVLSVQTARIRQTGIGGAQVAVVAVDSGSRLALPCGADVTFGAEVAVIARHCVGRVQAAGIGVARVVGTQIAVVAVRLGTGNAGSALALVTDGTDIPVVATMIVGIVDAAGIRSA